MCCEICAGRRFYRDPLIRAHTRLGGPILLVWDSLRAHLMPPMQEFIEANKDWLTVFQLPSCAPDLNPQEGIWSLVKRSLKQIRYRPRLVDGCLAVTGLGTGACPAGRPADLRG
ncbi:hypothetical protein GCM10020000_81060 [Streptomyces olivoverticillatus]